MGLRKAVILSTLFGIALGAAGTLAAQGAPARSHVKNLLQVALAEEFTPGREVLVDFVDLPPNTALDRHWHPGEEFHYYLEGEAEIRIEGRPAIIGKPGTVGHVPFRKRHQAIAGRQGAKVVVFRIHTKGEPWRYLDPADSTKRE